MFEGAWRPDWRRRVKYLARLAMTIEARAAVLDVCATNAFARALMCSRPRAFYPLMSHLLDRLWRLGLHTPAGARVYSIGFGFTSPRSLLAANVQGASIGIDGLEQNRRLTHAAHGMRPPYLLMHALKTLARNVGIDSLTGVDPLHHVKGRWNLRRSRLQFDYRSLWRDHGGARAPSGNWPLVTTARRLDRRHLGVTAYRPPAEKRA